MLIVLFTLDNFTAVVFYDVNEAIFKSPSYISVDFSYTG